PCTAAQGDRASSDGASSAPTTSRRPAAARRAADANRAGGPALRDVLDEDPLEHSVFFDLEIDVVRTRVRLRAVEDDPSVIDNDDLVGEGDRREPMGDDDRRPVAHRLAQAVADLRLRR